MRKDIKLNKDGIAPCKHCLKHKKKNVYPIVVEKQGLYYARCPDCIYEDPYEFLGLTEKKALAAWNRIMLGRGELNVEA